MRWSLSTSGAWRRTDLPVEVPLFHLSHEINLIENLQAVCWADLASHVLACFSQLLCCDSVAVFKFTKNVDQELESV